MINKEFAAKILEKHKHAENYPSTSLICKLMTRTLLLLFPEQSKRKIHTLGELIDRFDLIRIELSELLHSMEGRLDGSPNEIADDFINSIPDIYNTLLTDVEAIMKGDPAAHNEYEVIRAYPGFYAIAFYRLAHKLQSQNVPLLPRVITEYAHSKTGIDIHPAAKIGPYFFIDHGTGVVIGETSEIGECVKIYQGVTLGALSVSKNMAETKRHPTIEDNVVIYSGATILGGQTVIGHDSIVGGNVWLTKSLPPHSRVYHQAQIKLKNPDNQSNITV